MRVSFTSVAASVLLSGSVFGQGFVNWESPHVHPLELTPDGAHLLAVNTPDNRLEVFDASGGALVHLRSIQVGLDPVSVRARSSTEVWVVNHVSDSISIVHLPTGRVSATLDTADEPADVIFAGTVERAFVSCSQANLVQVFDPASLGLIQVIPIAGEDPRALARSASGDEVYLAVFESGNGTTVLAGGAGGGIAASPPQVVNDPTGPYGGVNPPPNAGAGFDPPVNPLNDPPIAVSLIVRKDSSGNWRDDNGTDWTAFVSGPDAAKSGRVVGWDLPDRDLCIIDADSLTLRYETRLMNVCMALGVHPSGAVTVVGTEATNEIRYEPNINGTFVRTHFAQVDPTTPGAVTIGDLNPHLDYSSSTVSQAVRDQSIGDPRGIAWNAAGTRAYVTGMGSNNLVVFDAAGARVTASPTEVGEGPTGVVLQESDGRAFVLNKFDASISVVSLGSNLETARLSFFDPSPPAIQAGRKHLYDSHITSGLGQSSCGSCHVDARMDQLGWDLGDPSGDMKSTAGQNIPLAVGPPWHPMKGPMTTQTLQDIIGKEPHHWRGDREGIEAFNGAYESLLGDDEQLTAGEMQEFEDFLSTIHFPPNPSRNFQNGLRGNLPLPGQFTTDRFGPAGLPMPNGNALRGLNLYRTAGLDGVQCVTCHTLPTGVGTDFAFAGPGPMVPFPIGPNGEHHSALVTVDGFTNVTMKTPQLRNMHEKAGMEYTRVENTSGFGYAHDGSIASITQFVAEPVFSFTSNQQVSDVVALMMSFAGRDLPQGSPTNPLEPPGLPSLDTHAAVGTQTTVIDGRNVPVAQSMLLANMRAIANTGSVGIVVKGLVAGVPRGFAYVGANVFQSDRSYETVGAAQLTSIARPGAELTFTVVPIGTEVRIGLDRDEDLVSDRDELDGGFDPADPLSTPSACALAAPPLPTGLGLSALDGERVLLTWTDNASDEDGWRVERMAPGEGFVPFAEYPADSASAILSGLECSTSYAWRLVSFNCGGYSPVASISGASGPCGPGTAFCFGVGCPCGNDDPTAGCANSTGSGARLSGSGSSSLAADDLLLVATGCPPNNSGLFFGADTVFTPPVTVGDGFGCAGGLSFRYFPGTVDGSGTFTRSNLVSEAPPGFLSPGATRHFQAWTRDVLCGPPPSPCPSPCGNNNNLSNAYTVTFVP